MLEVAGLANFGKEDTPEPIVGKYSQENAGRDDRHNTIARVMNKFRDLGFISYNGSIEVHSSLLTVLLYDKPQIRRDEAINAE